MFFPGESHGQRSLAGYSPRGQKELDTSKQVNNDSDVEHLAMCLVAIFTSYLENGYSVLSF